MALYAMPAQHRGRALIKPRSVALTLRIETGYRAPRGGDERTPYGPASQQILNCLSQSADAAPVPRHTLGIHHHRFRRYVHARLSSQFQ